MYAVSFYKENSKGLKTLAAVENSIFPFIIKGLRRIPLEKCLYFNRFCPDRTCFRLRYTRYVSVRYSHSLEVVHQTVLRLEQGICSHIEARSP